MADEPPDEEETLRAEEIVREGIMLGLRTSEGMNLASVERRAGVAPTAGREAAIAARIATGDLEQTADVLRVPRQRWLRLDGIVADLF